MLTLLRRAVLLDLENQFKRKIDHEQLFSCLGLILFVLFIPFFVIGHFWQRSYENAKILRNLCLFERQDGQDRKK